MIGHGREAWTSMVMNDSCLIEIETELDQVPVVRIACRLLIERKSLAHLKGQEQCEMEVTANVISQEM